MLPEFIKMLIYSYIVTPSAVCIKGEIKRCSNILNQEYLKDSQTIWSVMTIDWYDYYTNNRKMYREPLLNYVIRHDLSIAKETHICEAYDSYISDSIDDIEIKKLKRNKKEHERFICNSEYNYKKDFSKWINYMVWLENRM